MTHQDYSWLIAGLLLAVAPGTVLAAAVDKRTIKVSASSWEQKAHGGVGDFPPANTLDGSLAVESSWRAEGAGQWIQWDLGAPVKLRSVGLAFLFGDKRHYTFDLLVSNDPAATAPWRPIRLKAKSSGGTTELEWLDVGGEPVRYVRLVGYGNSSEKFPQWTNLTEVAFVAE